MIKRLLPILLLGAVLLAACGAPAAMQSAPVEESEFGGIAATGAPAEAPVADGARQGVDASGAAQVERLVIKNASLSLLVQDAAGSAAEIGRLAEGMGGFVVFTNVSETTYGPNATRVKQASVSIRVPAEQLDEALTRIKAMAVEVQSENVSGQDVTADYTDLQSRLKNLEVAEAQLVNIMDSATRTQDVLDVFNQLVAIREQIEVIRGQMKYYEESAAFSQISIELIPDVLAQPLEIGGWRPEGVVRDAFELLVRGLQALVSLLIYVGICGIPFALIIVLPAWLVLRGVRRRARARAEAKAEEAEAAAPGEEGTA
jgi:hypothetical protein